MPLALLLIPYGLFLLIFFIFALFALVHLFVFGEKSFTTFLATFLFIAGTVLALNTSWNLLVTIDWKESIAFAQNLLSP